MTIVVFDAIAATAFWSCATVETLTSAPVGGGSGVGGTAGPARAMEGAIAHTSAQTDSNRLIDVR